MRLLIFILFVMCLFSFKSEAKSVMLTQHNFCSLDGEVSGPSVVELKRCLAKKDAKRGKRNYPLYLYIKSPGGSIYHGLQFIAFAKTIKNLHTITEFSASMAAAIVQHLPGKRYTTEVGVFMFHRASGQFGGQFADGEVETQLKFWKAIVVRSEKTQAKRIGISLEEYKSRIVNEWWIYGEDNITENVADEVISIQCSAPLIGKTKTVKVNTIFGAYEKTVSDCPVLN